MLKKTTAAAEFERQGDRNNKEAGIMIGEIFQAMSSFGISNPYSSEKGE